MTRAEVEKMLKDQKDNCALIWARRPSTIALIVVIVTVLGLCGGVFGYFLINENRLTTFSSDIKSNRKSIERIEKENSIIIENQNTMLQMLRELRK